LINYQGVDRVVLNANSVVTVSNAASGIVVDANSTAAFASLTISGNSTVAATASNADVATLNLTSTTGAIIAGAVTFTGFETLIINSTNVNHTITGALTTLGNPLALDTVKIGGDKDLTLSVAPVGVEKIDATGFTGKLIMTAPGAEMLEIVGGDGNDTIYGGGNSSLATVVNMGKGDDTYVFGAKSDIVTGGDGADTFDASNLANTKLVNGVADIITDFTSGTDKIKVTTAIYNNTTDATLAVQTLTFNTDLATTLASGTYNANTAHFVKISGGALDGNYYLILNDANATFSATSDGVIQIIGSTTITAADIIS
jgi:Ca2+-binding RTX toxin-like protein